MDIIKNRKKDISIILKKIIKQHSFVFDIWVYGNFTDKTSDLDLIVVYKKNRQKLYFQSLLRNLSQTEQ